MRASVVRLTVPVAVLTAAASAAGVLLPSTYAQETLSWSTQGVGQDLVNLACVVPALAVTAAAVRRGSARALLVWQGLLLYLVYSYVLYAFFVHFGPVFPVYVATLGTAFYALLASVLTSDARAVASRAGGAQPHRALSALLAAVGILFALLWLADIGQALARGTVPQSVIDTGLPVNPVHVLDLAFVLPALLITADLLRRRHPLAIVCAVPLATFLVAMGVAIVAMAIVMMASRVYVPPAMPIAVSGIVIATVWILVRTLRTAAQ